LSAHGAHLVSFADEAEYQKMTSISFCTNEYWVGLNYMTPNIGRTDPKGWNWFDGSKHPVTKLSIVNTQGVDCVNTVVNNPTFNMASSYCSLYNRPYICKKAAKERAPELGDGTTPKAPVNPCQDGWLFFEEKCYFFSDIKTNYFHAQLSCQEKNGHLVTVHSHEEQNFITQNAGCNENVWIGIEKTVPCLSSNGADCWEWVDLSKVVYVNWVNQQTRLADPAGAECASTKGQWYNNVACSARLRYACKKGV